MRVGKLVDKELDKSNPDSSDRPSDCISSGSARSNSSSSSHVEGFGRDVSPGWIELTKRMMTF